MMLATALVAACAAEPEHTETTIGVTTVSTTAEPMEESSSSGAEPAPDPYGPCETDEDCLPFAGENGKQSGLAECREGRCTYACGEGWGGADCPDYLPGLGATCDGMRCRPIDCSPQVVDGRCCDEWCGGECYAPASEPAICECDGPSAGCPCASWCEESCAAGGLCTCLGDNGCPEGMTCAKSMPDDAVGHCA